jgi:hypothetical protein
MSSPGAYVSVARPSKGQPKLGQQPTRQFPVLPPATVGQPSFQMMQWASQSASDDPYNLVAEVKLPSLLTYGTRTTVDDVSRSSTGATAGTNTGNSNKPSSA